MKLIKKNLYGILLAVIAVFLILSGISRGEHTDVLEKAIRICLECIGIG